MSGSGFRLNDLNLFQGCPISLENTRYFIGWIQVISATHFPVKTSNGVSPFVSRISKGTQDAFREPQVPFLTERVLS
jgi:hypothetical protein